MWPYPFSLMSGFSPFRFAAESSDSDATPDPTNPSSGDGLSLEQLKNLEDVDRPDTVARYPDGTPILDSRGLPMQKPPFADTALAMRKGEQLADSSLPEKMATFYRWFRQTGTMDAQRIPDHKPTDRYQDYANYLFGSLTAGAQLPRAVAYPSAVIYNAVGPGRWRPGLLGTPPENLAMWAQGWDDYTKGKLVYGNE